MRDNPQQIKVIGSLKMQKRKSKRIQRLKQLKRMKKKKEYIDKKQMDKQINQMTKTDYQKIKNTREDSQSIFYNVDNKFFPQKNQKSLIQKIKNQIPQISIKDILKKSTQLNYQQIPIFNQKTTLQKLDDIFYYTQMLRAQSQNQTIFIINSKQKQFFVCFNHTDTIKYYQVDQIQAEIIKKRSLILNQIQNRVLFYNKQFQKQEKLSEVSKQNIMFLDFYQTMRKQTIQFVEKTPQQKNKQIQIQQQQEQQKYIQQIEPEQQKYIQQIEPEQPEKKYNDLELSRLIRQNFKRISINQQIDKLNYFSQIEAKWLKKRHRRIQSYQKFKQFLKKRKPKKGKADKFVLQSACTICLSHHLDDSNPFAYCNQCHFRFHKLCRQSTAKNCDRCIYKRLTKQAKQTIPQCFICFKKNLMVKKLLPNKFVHVFCLISHNLWDINGGSINIKPNQILQYEGVQCCSHCKMLSNSKLQVKCIECQQSTHVMCAYLAGCEIEVQQNDGGFELSVNCCNSNKQKIQKDRKFKLNYQKCVFRQNGFGKAQKDN